MANSCTRKLQECLNDPLIMGVTDWVETSKEWIKHEGIDGVTYSINQFYLGLLRGALKHRRSGVNIYELDWDLLIILDACRFDLIQEVEDEYPFLSNPGTIQSVGTTTWEWVENTFTEEYIDSIVNTVFITSNSHAQRVKELPFLRFEPVYEYGWDESEEAYPCETITDIAIDYGREHSLEDTRMIVHYMQPHFPSIPAPIGHGSGGDNVWKQLMFGRIEEKELWDAYKDNLRYVLGSVETLLNNIDAEQVVISSDHGNAKGEWWVYEHPHGIPIDCLQTVPWYVTTATDTSTKTPDTPEIKSATEDELKDRLQALGYR